MRLERTTAADAARPSQPIRRSVAKQALALAFGFSLRPEQDNKKPRRFRCRGFVIFPGEQQSGKGRTHSVETHRIKLWIEV